MELFKGSPAKQDGEPRFVGGCTHHSHFCTAATGLFLRVRESQVGTSLVAFHCWKIQIRITFLSSR